jgi:hypothetical protein
MTSIPRHRRFAAYVFTVLTLAACNTPTHVASDYDQTAAFSSYKSFTLIERPHPGLPNPFVAQRTSDAIRAELAAKGFTYVPTPVNADFAVDFTVGARDRLDVRSYPVGPFLGGSNLQVDQYQEGRLAIDVFDVRTRKPVWRGQAEKELSQSDIDRTGPLIREAVAAVLANFPPK